MTTTKHIINTDTQPLLLKGWEIEEHRQCGQIEWDAEKVLLFLTEPQQARRRIDGHGLRKELENKSVLNACVLDYLLINPHLIPKEWKDRSVTFWGTVFRVDGGGMFVCCIYHDGKQWCRGAGYLHDYNVDSRYLNWDTRHPAAVLAS